MLSSKAIRTLHPHCSTILAPPFLSSPRKQNCMKPITAKRTPHRVPQKRSWAVILMIFFWPNFKSAREPSSGLLLFWCVSSNSVFSHTSYGVPSSTLFFGWTERYRVGCFFFGYTHQWSHWEIFVSTKSHAEAVVFRFWFVVVFLGCPCFKFYTWIKISP